MVYFATKGNCNHYFSQMDLKIIAPVTSTKMMTPWDTFIYKRYLAFVLEITTDLN